MAPPDINSVTPTRPSRAGSNSNSVPNASSLHASPGASRRTSNAMGPPPLPTSSSHNQTSTGGSQPASPRPLHAITMPVEHLTTAQSASQVPSQGPIRHPRPLTAAELHLELEREQESIVNRLTRELSALRAQTASVASTTSSTSDLFTTSQFLPDPPYLSTTYGATSGTGASIIPTSARRHRSSSNLSSRSARSAREAVARDAASTSVSAVAAPRDSERSHQTSARQSLDIQRPETSRQNSYGLALTTTASAGSYAMHRSASNANSPHAPPLPHTANPPRSTPSTSHSRNPSQQGQALGTGHEGRSPSFSTAQATQRYEEAATQRQELEAIKKENEALKQRVRDLERQLTTAATVPTTSATSLAQS